MRTPSQIVTELKKLANSYQPADAMGGEWTVPIKPSVLREVIKLLEDIHALDVIHGGSVARV